MGKIAVGLAEIIDLHIDAKIKATLAGLNGNTEMEAQWKATAEQSKQSIAEGLDILAGKSDG